MRLYQGDHWRRTHTCLLFVCCCVLLLLLFLCVCVCAGGGGGGRPTPGFFKRRTFDSSGLSTEETLISAPTVPQCRALEWVTEKQSTTDRWWTSLLALQCTFPTGTKFSTLQGGTEEGREEQHHPLGQGVTLSYSNKMQPYFQNKSYGHTKKRFVHTYFLYYDAQHSSYNTQKAKKSSTTHWQDNEWH